MDPSLIISIFISILFSAFFSGIEIAFVSSNKLKIELDKKMGAFQAKLYSKFVKKPSRFITTLLVGNNIALVIYGISMAKLIEPFLQIYIDSTIGILLIQTVISTLIILVTAEFLPKAIFSLNPNKMLAFFVIPVVISYYILFPIVVLVSTLSNWVLRYILRLPETEVKYSFGMIDLDNLLKEASLDQEDVENEIEFFQNALDFTQTKARDCMIPRTEIAAFEINDSLEDLRNEFIETGLSKIIIYRDNIDNVIGYVHSAELFKRPDAIKHILLPISFVPETMPASEVLELLLSQKRSMAIVVDEFGGTSGLLTMEDVVEEIFGDIEDEHDVEVLTEIKHTSTHYTFAARLEIDYLNKEYDLKLPESDDYDTLGGLITYYLERIPNENEVLNIKDISLIPTQVSDRRIELVELKLINLK
jgi:putative hemolysin